MAADLQTWLVWELQLQWALNLLMLFPKECMCLDCSLFWWKLNALVSNSKQWCLDDMLYLSLWRYSYPFILKEIYVCVCLRFRARNQVGMSASYWQENKMEKVSTCMMTSGRHVQHLRWRISLSNLRRMLALCPMARWGFLLISVICMLIEKCKSL